jgi:hypothetical protein
LAGEEALFVLVEVEGYWLGGESVGSEMGKIRSDAAILKTAVLADRRLWRCTWSPTSRNKLGRIRALAAPIAKEL